VADPRRVARASPPSSLDLRTLRGSEADLWRRLHYLEASLASEARLIGALVADHQLLQTSLPSDQVDSPSAGSLTKRPVAVSHTRTILGQAITDFVKEVKEVKEASKAQASAGAILGAVDALFDAMGLGASPHRPLPTHQATRILEVLDDAFAEPPAALPPQPTAAAQAQGASCPAASVKMLALLRLLPLLRDPTVALAEGFWTHG
jgi:hypothetical protein